MTKLRTSLAFSQWPEQDRKCWTNAISKGDFLEPDGRAAHWADATKIQVQKGYSKFLFSSRMNASRGTAFTPMRNG